LNLVTKAAPIIAACKDADVVIVDTETRSLHPWVDGQILAGVGVKPLNGEMFYLTVRHKDSVNGSIEEVRKLFKALRGKTLIFHNAKYDMAVLWQEDIDLTTEYILDTMVMMRLVSEDEPSYALKKLGDMYYTFEDGELTSSEVEKALRAYMKLNECFIINEDNEKEYRYDMVPASYIADPYVKNDLRLTEFLYKNTLTRIVERDLLELLHLESDLTQALFDMERHGMKLDIPYIDKEAKDVGVMVNRLKKECFKITEDALNYIADNRKNGDVVEQAENALDVLYDQSREHTKIRGQPWDGTYKPGIKDIFNAGNPHFIKKVFEGMQLVSNIKTPTGRSSWNKVALASFDDPIAEKVVRIRAGLNMLNYYKAFKKLCDKNGVLHASIMQSGARTGRMSCRDPNLQNIPSGVAIASRVGALVSAEKMKKLKEEDKARKEKAARYAEHGKQQIGFDAELAGEIADTFEMRLFKRVKGAFIPREGSFLLSIDWQNVEMRIFSEYADEKEMQETFRLGLDIHRLTARAAFGMMPDEHTQPDMFKWVRQLGKQVAFGLLYGMGVGLLAIETGKTKEEAQEFMKNFFARFKNANTFIKSVSNRVKAVGYLRNKWGRRRYLTSEEAYKGINYLIQGTSADLMKDAIIRIFKLLRNYKTQMLMTVHDEIVFDIPWDEADEIIPLIVEEMETCAKLKNRLQCTAEYGNRWGELTKLSCEPCEGKGITVDISKNELIEALFVGNNEKINSAKIEHCRRCDGHGYDLRLLRRVL